VIFIFQVQRITLENWNVEALAEIPPLRENVEALAEIPPWREKNGELENGKTGKLENSDTGILSAGG